MNKLITVGVPAYKAENQIDSLLSSIMIQTIRDEVTVIIASDNPSDNYNFILDRFPELDIKVLPCEKNTGPGLARQRALDACETDWITFMDADDVLYTPFALENLKNNISMNCIEVQGAFLQEHSEGNLTALQRQEILANTGQVIPRAIPNNNVNHPWVFGRLYNVNFIRENNISFSELRAMEDGEFNWKIRMSIEGTPLKINVVNEPIYLWKAGSEHSITRIGIKENGGIPLYNWDLCQVGATVAAINAIQFCKEKNPFNGGIIRFTVEHMVSLYFTYIQCLEKKPLFAEQCYFNAKRFYNYAYKEIEHQINKHILKNVYTIQRANVGQDLVDIIPEITFFDFLGGIANEQFGGKEEFESIRSDYPEWVTELDMKSGVLGTEGYIYTTNERS